MTVNANDWVKPLLNHSQTVLTDLEQGTTVVDGVVTNITFPVHRQVDKWFLIVITHDALSKKEEPS